MVDMMEASLVVLSVASKAGWLVVVKVDWKES